ncbi:MAG TPA: YggT family protein [Candidatus Agrococcus pullicola]|uniref:YggT family protein n=1 Tax=Candidatus Agrococcus pullicola TaxID=2838429 RepID=A0A9D1YU88_9MICO|nr:YggT family protein [Candidatus Agrococcus pullicola]
MIFWITRVYFYILWGRVIIDLVAALKRDWKPKGFILAISIFLFKLTDPPVKFLRRFIKPVRIGQVSLDLSVLILFIALIILMNVASLIAMM